MTDAAMHDYWQHALEELSRCPARLMDPARLLFPRYPGREVNAAGRHGHPPARQPPASPAAPGMHLMQRPVQLNRTGASKVGSGRDEPSR